MQSLPLPLFFRTSVFLTFLAGCFASLLAQAPDIKVEKLPLMHLTKVSTVAPMEITEDWHPVLRNTFREPLAGSPGQESLIERRKAEADREKRQNPSSTNGVRQSNTADLPVYVSGFAANVRDLGNPNDNDMAISRGGRIVSVVNTNVSGYRPDGTELFSMSLEAFTPGTGNNQKFDPRVLYDPLHDRFIFSCLNGFDPSSSEVIIAFSSTNRPEDPWNVYSFSGGFTINMVPVWADFPQIGVSEEELFLEANLFDGSSTVGSGQGSVVWQIELAGGYSGGTLVVQPHTLQGTFSITPVHGGVMPYGPNFFFVDDIGAGGDIKIFLLEIDNTIANGGQFKTPVTLNSSINYRLSPNADQRGTNMLLRTGDCRVHSAYRQDDKIYFAFNARNNNKSGIFFGKIGLSPIAPTFSTLTTMLIGSDDYEYGYPRLAFGGCTSGDGEHSTLMMVNLASQDTFPGCGVIHIDTLGEVSEPAICILGEEVLGLESRNIPVWPWGDYTGISSPRPGEVWTSGYFVPSDSSNKTWISRVYNPACTELGPPSNIGPETEPVENVQLYPNPAAERIYLDFEVKISGRYHARVVDLTGKVVHTLLSEQLEPGLAKAGMGTGPLAPGHYFLMVEKDGIRIADRKFQVK